MSQADEKPVDKLPTRGDAFEGLPLLAGSTLRLERGADDLLRLQTAADRCHDGVAPVALFPLTHPDQFIRFSDKEGKEIGLLERVSDLAPASRAVLNEELGRRYFTPEVRSIQSLTSRHGVLSWETTTDRGRRAFEVASRDDVRTLPDGQVLIRDADGNRYRIPNYHRLDTRSRKLLEPQL